VETIGRGVAEDTTELLRAALGTGRDDNRGTGGK